MHHLEQLPAAMQLNLDKSKLHKSNVGTIVTGQVTSVGLIIYHALYQTQQKLRKSVITLHQSSSTVPCALLTLGAHAQRGLRYLGLCVCVSVTLNLTSRVFVRLTKDTTY